MTESEAIRAANILRESGCFEAADKMEEIAETSRKQHFQDMQARFLRLSWGRAGTDATVFD